MATSPPTRREDFEIAIICSLTLEYDAVSLVFDEFWDEEGDPYGRAPGDTNQYTTGRIGKHNVVLALLQRGGIADAAGAAASLRSSYGMIRLALLVGVCGGVPFNGDTEILLGDVVISNSLVRYQYGRAYPDGFERENNFQDNPSKPNKDIAGLLALFDSKRNRMLIKRKTDDFLKTLQLKAVQEGWGDIHKYPGTASDRLFESDYWHQCQSPPTCVCGNCNGKFDPVCGNATKYSCQDMGCENTHLIPRKRLELKRELELQSVDAAQSPAIHLGCVASGDTVTKCAQSRDQIAKDDGVIAFEREGAGAWEELPCIIIKGVSNYADGHNSKEWQHFAAAAAASAAKAVLERYSRSDRPRAQPVEEAVAPNDWSQASQGPVEKRPWLIEFGRDDAMEQLLTTTPPTEDEDERQRVAVKDLRGVAET